MSDDDEIEMPEAKDRRINHAVAITVVLLSVTMALGKIKDNNLVQAMQAAQARQIDLWDEYQATRIKLRMEEIAARQGGAGSADASAQVTHYDAESGALKAQADASKEAYKRAEYRHEQFDLAEGFASITLACTAIAALVESWWLLGLAWATAAGALLFAAAAFLGLPFHPDRLVGFLT